MAGIHHTKATAEDFYNEMCDYIERNPDEEDYEFGWPAWPRSVRNANEAFERIRETYRSLRWTIGETEDEITIRGAAIKKYEDDDVSYDEL